MTIERKQEILSAVVREYVRTAEPVGSKAVAGARGLGLSPATIRSVMAELESEGLLTHPHTSAGRVPTDAGFRRYIDSLVSLDEPEEEDRDALERVCEHSGSVDELLAETARALSALTHYGALMFVPRRDCFVIKHISLMPVDANSIMVVMLSTIGQVRTRHIRLDTGVGRIDLERMSNYLASIAAGLTIEGLRARIVEEMKNEKTLYDRLLSRALKLGELAVESVEDPVERDLYFEGRLNIMDQPEFRDDFDRMRRLFSAFEEKSLLVRILDMSTEDGGDGTRVILGSEGGIQAFDGLSFVTSACGGGRAGSLGVVGPVRMDYSRIVPLVDYAAGLLSKVF